MKSLVTRLLITLSLAVAAARAEDDTPNIFIEVQIVAVPQKVAAPLVPELSNEKTIEAAFQKIQTMIASGTAQLVGWPMVITRNGQRAQVECVREIRYPREFDAGGVAIHFHDKDGIATKEPRLELQGVESNPIPTNFETRNTGTTLEVEPVLSNDGKMIDLNLVPQHVLFMGMQKHTVEHKGQGTMVVEQPTFDTMKTQTSFRLKNGGRVLLGIFSTREPADHLEFFILKAETRQP